MKTLLIATVVALLSITQAHAVTLHVEGFEASTWPDPAIGRTWQDNNGSTVTRVASGTNGIASSSGSFHAEISKVGSAGAFSYLGGNDTAFRGGWTTSIDIYVDLAALDGFEISQAVTRNTGGHAQDNIFHVRKVGQEYTVGVSHNSNYTANVSGFAVAPQTIQQNGWYTFQWSVMPSAGPLGVETIWTVLQDDGSTFWQYSKDTGLGYDINDVGGHRYMWFTYTGSGNGALAIDNATVSAVPEPLTVAGVLMGLGGIGRYLRRRTA